MFLMTTATAHRTLPTIIQGGMGVGVSHWRLANAVSSAGQLGVVSGTALDQILARRLQDGDPGGHMQRAIEAFPFRGMGQRVLDRYFIPGGKSSTASYRAIPLWSIRPPRELHELCIVANFVEVWLAKDGHSGAVGINYLEKIQWPHLTSIFGAMLAGVDYVLMGAGIPMKIPGVLDAYARLEPASYPLHVVGALPGDDTLMRFDPAEFIETPIVPPARPAFLAIVASNTLAATLVKKANGVVDGLIVEGPTAGGHNAPPRGRLALDASGQPIYGERDRVDLAALRTLGVPFWLAGGYGGRAAVESALAAGAAGVQVGTAFAYCEESGLRHDLKAAIRESVAYGTVPVRTDPLASPTGFPFKVVHLRGSVAEREIYETRPRVCDLGYLRESYRSADGTIGYRCAAEPVNVFVSKGGDADATTGRMCICNALMASGGHAQVRARRLVEPPVVTSGDDLDGIRAFMAAGASYPAEHVVRTLLGEEYPG
jgi:nitronate monooxygenase